MSVHTAMGFIEIDGIIINVLIAPDMQILSVNAGRRFSC
jgi:hypothetical protein